MLSVDAWMTIRYLDAQRLGISAIARELGRSSKAVRRALRSERIPRDQRPRRPNPQLVPFEARIRAWYFCEPLIGSPVLRELRSLNYAGSASALYTYLTSLRTLLAAWTATERHDTAPGHQGQQFAGSRYYLELGGVATKIILHGVTPNYSWRMHYTTSLDETLV